MALPQLILIPGRLNDGDLFRDQVAALQDVARPVVADVTRGRSFAELAASVLAMAEDRFAAAYLAPQHRGDEAILGRIRAMTERLGKDVFVRQSRLERPDNRAALAALTCPVLVACGAEDTVTPPAHHREMAALIPGAKLEIIPDAGHMTPLEQPDAVTALLRALLTGR